MWSSETVRIRPHPTYVSVGGVGGEIRVRCCGHSPHRGSIMITAQRQMPGPPSIPWVGEHTRVLAFLRDPVGFLVTLHQRYGMVASFSRGSSNWIAATGPEVVPILLQDPNGFHISPLPIPPMPGTALRRLTSGLTFMDGERHKRQRRLVATIFRGADLERYQSQMAETAVETIRAWRIGSTVAISDEMKRLTMKILGQAIFGLHEKEELERADGLTSLIDRWLRAVTSPQVLFFPKDYPGTPFRALLRLSERLERQILSTVEGQRSADDSRVHALGDLLRARDEEGHGLSLDELVGHLNLMFIAGHETSANALCWTLLMLTQHPVIAKRLQQEVRSTLAGQTPTIGDLRRMPFLERVVKESLRLFPPVPYIGRVAVTDMALGGTIVPRRSRVIFSPYVLHRGSWVGPNPQRFDPDRWLTHTPKPGEFVPFGIGPHACLGSTFAMLEIQTVLAILVQNVSLALTKPTRVQRHVHLAMSPKGGLTLGVRSEKEPWSGCLVSGDIREMVDLPYG